MTRIHIKEKSKNIWTYAHIPMYMGLTVISMYIREKGIKSRIWQFLHVFRDVLGNIKGTKMIHGVVEAWKITGGNSKGFSPIKVPN